MARVDPTLIPAPAPVEWLEDPAAPACFRTSEGVRTSIPEDWRETRRYYFADIVHLDRQLGLVLDALERAGREAWVIFVSDHGELLLDHGFSGKGERHYDACVRVPLIISGPGLRRGAVVEDFVQLEDIFPTVLEMAGIEPPAPRVMGPYLKETPRALAGRSLLPLCRGERPADWRRDAYIESYNNITTATPRNWARSVRTGQWRYTMVPEGQGEQLFHLATDPDEQVNLARDAAHASVRRELRDRLLDLVILQDYPQTPRDLFALGVH
jgi:arylsulfatase A-like enzyme